MRAWEDEEEERAGRVAVGEDVGRERWWCRHRMLLWALFVLQERMRVAFIVVGGEGGLMKVMYATCRVKGKDISFDRFGLKSKEEVLEIRGKNN